MQVCNFYNFQFLVKRYPHLIKFLISSNILHISIVFSNWLKLKRKLKAYRRFKKCDRIFNYKLIVHNVLKLQKVHKSLISESNFPSKRHG